jgi:hypothetical protein
MRLEAVFLISHRAKRVTVVSRSGNRWEEREVRAGERVEFDDAIAFDVDDLYAVAPSVA